MRIVKEHLNASIEKGLKKQAKDMGLNISEAIEQTLRDKTKDIDKTVLILHVEKYGISLIPNNWVVGRLSNAYLSQAEGVGKDFYDTGTQTYHPTLHQALIQLSRRLLEDKLRKECKDKPTELRELANLIQEHHEWFINLVKAI